MFYDSIETAVAASLREAKPLLVLVLPAGGDGCSCWAKTLVQQCEESVKEMTVPLEQVEGSDGFAYFNQLFKVSKVPSIFLIRGPVVVRRIEENIPVDEFKEIISLAGQRDSAANRSATQTPTAAPRSSPAREITEGRTHETGEDVSTQCAPGTSSCSMTENARGDSATRQTPPVQRGPKKDHPRSNESTSVASGSGNKMSTTSTKSKSDSERYLCELKKHRQAEAEERKRILRMVEADREERRSRRHSAVESPAPRQHPKEARSMSNSNEVALQVRLLDGSAIKYRFGTSATLADVRDWVDKHRTDGTDAYVFFRNMPRTTFDETQEQKNLRDLGLWPSSTLIIRPVANATSAYAVGSNSPTSWMSYGAQKMSNAIYSFLGIGSDPRAANFDDSEQSYDDNLDDTRKSGRTTYNGNQTNLEDNSRR